jgi:beta-glucanase (GH16 family)
MIPQSTKADPELPGEIDILEVNNQNPYKVSGYAHDGPIFSYEAKEYLAEPTSSRFHIYGVDWTPTGITWTLDGKPYGHINAYKDWPFDRPFIMLLTLAVGGTWAGSPTASTVFPSKMQVTWVRVYKMVNLSFVYRTKPRSAVTGARLTTYQPSFSQSLAAEAACVKGKVVSSWGRPEFYHDHRILRTVGRWPAGLPLSGADFAH